MSLKPRTVTRNDTQGQLAAIWDVLEMAREDLISEDQNGPHDAQWETVCEAMAWIAEDLNHTTKEDDS